MAGTVFKPDLNIGNTILNKLGIYLFEIQNLLAYLLSGLYGS